MLYPDTVTWWHKLTHCLWVFLLRASMVIWNRRNYLHRLNLAKMKKVCLVSIHLSQALRVYSSGMFSICYTWENSKDNRKQNSVIASFFSPLVCKCPTQLLLKEGLTHVFWQLTTGKGTFFLLIFAGGKQQYFPVFWKFPNSGSYYRLGFFSSGSISTFVLFIGLLWTKKNFPTTPAKSFCPIPSLADPSFWSTNSALHNAANIWSNMKNPLLKLHFHTSECISHQTNASQRLLQDSVSPFDSFSPGERRMGMWGGDDNYGREKRQNGVCAHAFV